MTLSKLVVRSIVCAGMTAALSAAAGCNSGATGPNGVPTGVTGPVAMKMTLGGTILDGNGAALSGVLTTASLAGVSVREATTDSAGKFSLGTIDLLSTSSVIFSATKPGYAPYAETLSPQSAVQVNRVLTLLALVRLPQAGNIGGSLLVSDPPVYVGEPYDSDYAWQARSFYFEAPSDSDLDVVLAWPRDGNAALQMWAAKGNITSRADGSSQTIRLPRGTSGTLIVGQPLNAGSLTQSVQFALTTRR